MAAYELTPPELLLLERACRSADKLDRLDRLIAETSPLVRGSTGANWRPNPLWALASDAERILISQVAALRLPADDEEIEPVPDLSARRRGFMKVWDGPASG